MKIGKKFIISNILISLIAMIAMSIIISMIVSNYIKQDITDKLIKENKEIEKWFKYKKFLFLNNGELEIDESFYKYGLDSSIISAAFVIKDNNSAKLLIKPFRDKDIFTESEVDRILTQDLKKAYDITLTGKLHLAYNNKTEVDIEGKTFSILITTLIPNLHIRLIITQIIIVLIASVFIISMLSVIITSFVGRKITKPIEILKKITEKIADKNFNEKAEISTGDELEGLAESINNMAESIRKHDIEQKRFYENISHELKTPLTVISGYAQGIKTNIFDDNEKALDTIIEESAQIKKQLENVIYLSKLDGVNEFFHFQNSSINETISNALKKLDSIIILNDIDIIYEPIDDVMLSMDKDKIMRMLINILSNCLKYTKDTIEIGTKVSEGWYQIMISDNGEGFSKKILENPFSRIIVGEKGGNGIGLSIVKKIVDGHDGNITLGNNKDGGAIYTVELPVK